MPEIISERILYLYDRIDSKSVNEIIKNIQKIERADHDLKKWFETEMRQRYNPAPIQLYIDSPGGSVYSTLGLYDLIRHCQTPVHSTVLGLAASGAAVILVAGHKRFALPNSSILIHSVSSYTMGKSEELKDDVEETVRLNEIVNHIFLEQTYLTAQQLNDKDKYRKDWWLSAREALAFGIVDEII